MKKKLPFHLISGCFLLLFAICGLCNTSYAQVRQGAIDLATNSGDYIQLNHQSWGEFKIGDGPFTVEMWVKNPQSTSGDYDFNFFTYRSNTSTNRNVNISEFVFETTDRFEVVMKKKRSDSWSNTKEYGIEGLNLSTFYNTWRHVAFCYDDNSRLRIYVDGELVVSSYDTRYEDNGGLFNSYNNNGGTCKVGGENKDGDKGKFYVAEIRCWNANIYSYIDDYWDKEVNQEHPKYSNLKYYWHGTEQYSSSGVYKFKDVMNNYDAIGSSNVVDVLEDQYPPIKPPNFDPDDSDQSWAILATTTCKNGYITISWWDFIDDFNYIDLLQNGDGDASDNREPYYALFRDEYSDGTPIATYAPDDGNFFLSHDDYDITPGQVHTYRLYTYWNINGVTYYSDTYVEKTGYAKSEYSAPNDLTVTGNCDAEIEVDWTSDEEPPYWTIKRSTTSDFSSDVVTIGSTSDGSTTIYTDQTPTVETEYFYKVYANGKDDNNCSVASTDEISEGVTTSQSPLGPHVTLVSNSSTDPQQIELDWTDNNTVTDLVDSWKIVRTESDGSNEVVTENIDPATLSYDDSDILSCTSYKYKVYAVNDACAVDGVADATQEVSGFVSESDLSDKITDFNASKGYYSDNVLLEWDINGSASTLDGFEIYRSLIDANEYKYITSLQNELAYRDETALGGVMYSYKIYGVAECNGEDAVTQTWFDDGFVIPYGVANGIVQYEGGNAVEDVMVSFEKKNGNTGYSLDFDGSSYVKVAHSDDINISKKLTLEAWIKPTSTSGKIIKKKYDDNYTYYLAVSGSEIDFAIKSINDVEFIASAPIEQYEYQHVAGTYDGQYLRIFVNGEIVDSVSSTDDIRTSTDNMYIGKNYSGFIDEVRIWDIARTADEIEDNYNRIINAGDDNLACYFRCEEGFGSAVYDASNDGVGNFHENHGTFVGTINFSSEIPTDNQLGIRGTTDSTGVFTVDYIPYSAGGEIMRVTPSLGQHQFSPGSRTIYVGNGAQTHNGLDFDDISSFSVSGIVNYYNTEYPVEGVSVLIDGSYAVGIDNNIVKTDKNGEFTVDVPIGYHYLSLEKGDHIFSQGHYPALDDDGDIVLGEFTEDITSPLQFYDSTFVKVAGRVVGGEIEGKKDIGFGFSTNNIGVSDITFTIATGNTYDINTTDAVISTDTTISTDPYTGEYEIYLLPETWIVSVTDGEDSRTASDINYSYPDDSELYLGNSLEQQVNTYELLVDDDPVDTYETQYYYYNHELTYIIREIATVSVYDEDDAEFIGDPEITFINHEDEYVTLDLTNLDYLDYPIFQMGKEYTAKISVYEYYENPFHPDGSVEDKVPVEGAQLYINNYLGIDDEGLTEETDSNGEFMYTFTGGAPNVVNDGDAPFTKNFELVVEIDNISVTWREDDPYRAYVLGFLPTYGTDFITYGPEIPDIVLRDPPGSHSYAYIEQGSSLSITQAWEYGQATTSELDWTLHKGVTATFGGGLMGPVTEVQNKIDSEYGLEIQKEYNHEGKYVETITFTERIETSNEPEMVGSMADLYIGKGNNFYMSKSKNLKFIEKDYCENHLDPENYLTITDADGTEYILGIMDGLTIDENDEETYFVYSQYHIIYHLLPNLYEARDQLFIDFPDNYESNLPLTSRYYGMSNSDDDLYDYKLDSIAQNPSVDTANFSYTFTSDDNIKIDSVDALNEQISIWLNVIAMNEAEKASAELVQNISIDGGSGVYQSEIEEERSADYSYKRSNSFKAYMNADVGLTLNGTGFSLASNFDMSTEIKTEKNNGLSNSVKFGYVIDERDAGDYYSIDVKKEEGVSHYTKDDFAEWLPNKDEWVDDITSTTGLAGGIGGTKTIAQAAVNYFISKTVARSNAYTNVAFFALDVAYQMYDMINLANFRDRIHEKMDNTATMELNGFSISSPIFSVRGGQSKCPYEDEEYSGFYIDSVTDQPVKLHTATLQREVPVISVEPTITTNVNEDDKAYIKVIFENHSASNTDMWYELRIDDGSNPHGLQMTIDGDNVEGSLIVPAWEKVEKTMIVEKGDASVYDYENVGLIFHSICQFDPSNEIPEIADTAYFSVHFVPSCTSVSLKNMQDDWIVNNGDNDQMEITLSDYNINNTTLENLKFQYKTPGGDPLTAMTWYMDQDDYDNDPGVNKALIDNNPELDLSWDVPANDGEYMIRAISTCAGSPEPVLFEGNYFSGTIDRSSPEVFGTPQPADGILSPGEDIYVEFNEEINSGIITDNRISVRGVLNGTEISHNASVYFDGANDYAAIADGVILNDKSFTIEFWAKQEPEGEAILFSQGANASENCEIKFNSSNQLEWTIDGQSFTGDPSVAYNSTYPDDAWHHYAFVYDGDNDMISAYVDDKVVIEETNVTIDYEEGGQIYIGNSITGTGTLLEGNIHDLRIWNKARTVNEVYEMMGETVSGNEIGLYRCWEMNEGKGDILIDKSRNQQMTLYAEWDIEPEGWAIQLDGASSQYINLSSANVAIDDETDMTIEFWFKAAAPSSDICFLSNGKGDGVEGYPEFDATNSLSIVGQADGKIIVNSAGYEFEAASTNYLDNNWHHFALVLDRNGNTRSYIDGALQHQTLSSNMGYFAGANIWVGARGWMADAATSDFDSYYTGGIDEIRFWNTARTATQIELYSNSKLSGDEDGLLSYYPFEKYEENSFGQMELISTIYDQSIDDDGDFLNSTAPELTNVTEGNLVTQVAPEIKDARPVQDVAFDFVANSEGIVIEITEPTAKIENVILEISVNNIFDLHGNYLLSPQSWTAYIDQNQVVWNEESIAIEKDLYGGYKFSVDISNLGGTAQDFELNNIPSWLEASASSGSLQPNSTLTIDFTVNEGLGSGHYEETLYLSTDYGFDETFDIDLRVVKSLPEDWAYDSQNFEYSMNLIGIVKINGIISTDKYDKVGAFIDGQCVGIASLEYFPEYDTYLTFLDIYNTGTNNDQVDLKIWDASAGKVYSFVSPDFNFTEGELLGTPQSPEVITSQSLVEQQIELKKGWQWVSFNLSTADINDVNTMLSSVSFEQNNTVKSYNRGFDAYDTEFGWDGELSDNGGFNNTEMFMLELPENSELSYFGEILDPALNPITIHSNWNWIGYIPSENMSIKDAFSAYDAEHNDVVKDQYSFAIYDQNMGWLGSLRYMIPGRGYKYFSNKSANSLLTYPESGFLKTGSKNSITGSGNDKCTMTPEKYNANMSLIAHLEANDILLDDSKQIICYSGNECRGVATIQHIGEENINYLFLTIYGDASARLNFMLSDTQSGESWEISEHLTYSSDKVEGTVDNPFQLTISTESSSISVADLSNVNIYPNPFNDRFMIDSRFSDEKIRSVKVANISGQVMALIVPESTEVLEINSSAFETGVYFVTITFDKRIVTKRIVKYE